MTTETKPAGQKFGESRSDDDPKPSPRAMGQKTVPADNSGCPCLGDVVTLKSGGPAMTVIGLDAATTLPGGPATDPEITPERRASGQTSVVLPSLATVLCQWFTGNGECKEQRFSVNALVVSEHAKPWTPNK